MVTAMLLSIAVYGQGYQLVDSTYSHTKLDQDSLYYDEMAYLDFESGTMTKKRSTTA